MASVPYTGTYATKAITTDQHSHNGAKTQEPGASNQDLSPASVTSQLNSSSTSSQGSTRDSNGKATKEDLSATHQNPPKPWHSIILDSVKGDPEKDLEEDLSVERINQIHKHLWWVGRPENINSLHRQKAMLRTIVISEKPMLHLVWFDSTIFIKPLPEYLLDQEYFTKNICTNPKLYKLACGFLLSYSKLIRYKSDHKIAIDEGLIPEYMDWPSWCKFSSDIGKIEAGVVNKRYRYGELRLGRLNQIYWFCKGNLRGFYTVHTKYNHFFQENFGWLLLLFAFLTIILTAMQVVLTTPQSSATPQNKTLFEDVSYVFGITSIMVVVIGTFVALALFVVLFWWNFAATLRYLKNYREKRKEAKEKLTLNLEAGK